ncbi:MAG TPA: NUDIX hydrolase [Acidimicrobiales bacterium]
MRAAGGLVVRHRAGDRDGGDRDGGFEIVLVHRPKYDDWSLPKGKRDPAETDEQCAVREVEEETGLRCRLGRELLPTAYVDARGRSKVVRYWAMTVVGERAFTPNDEIDELRWASVDDVAAVLTYERDVEVVRSLGAHRVRGW